MGIKGPELMLWKRNEGLHFASFFSTLPLLDCPYLHWNNPVLEEISVLI